jgi:hypothetical protein
MKIKNFVMLIPLIALLTSFSADAQTPTTTKAKHSASVITTKANGCGSENGFDRKVVPNEISISKCTFLDSCNKHDICYSQCSFPFKKGDPPQCEYLRCKKGGDLFNKQECQSNDMIALNNIANIRKADCDGEFLKNIVKNNNGKDSCIAWAHFYTAAVGIGGKGAFLGATDHDAIWTEEEKKNYYSAFQMFFENFTEEEIKNFKNKLDTGQITLDMNKQIIFIPNVGLKNK